MRRTLIKNIFSFLLLLTLFLVKIHDLYPQGYTIRSFTINNGLPHNSVRDIIRDKSGYLWISTWDGLSRYDGYDFKNFHHIPGDSTSLPYFSTSKIVMDADNDLWILTDNGKIARFNRRTGTFSTIKIINGEKIGNYASVCGDSKGRVWIVYDTVFMRYSPADRKYTRFRGIFNDRLNSVIKDYIYDLAFENENVFWLTSNTTCRYSIDEKAGTITLTGDYQIPVPTLPADKVIRNYEHTVWYKMYFDKAGRKWLFSDNGLFNWDENSASFREFKGRLPVMDFDKSRFFFWGDLAGGLNILRPGNDSLIRVPAETVQLLKFVCQGGDDVLWFSNTSFTGNSLGLSQLIFTPGYFTKYTDPELPGEKPAVFSVCVDRDKNIWMGVRGRKYITVITPKGKLIRKYTPASGNPGFYGPVRSIKRTPRGLWIGYFTDMLLFYDYRTGKFTPFNPGKFMYRALEVRSDGKLYIGNNNLYIYDPLTGKLDLLFDSIPGGGNFRFRIGRDSTLWSGNPYGIVLKYIPSEGKVIKLHTVNYNNNIEDVCPGDSNNIWVASLGGGLIRYNSETGKSRVFTTSDGLSNNTVYSILRDREGYIWVSTDDGISRLNPLTGIFKNFGMSEGLEIKEFNSGASFTDDDGKFWFGGMGGVVCFSPDSINKAETNNIENKIILTSLLVSGKPKIPRTSLNSCDTIILNKGEDNFHLIYAVSDFANSEKTIYRYKLSGLDREWRVTDHTNRNINYTNLPPGLFCLILQATDRTGQWNVSRQLYIRVIPRIYQSRAFIIVVSLLLFGLFHLIISLYLRNYRMKTSQVLDNLRLKALRGQMNPHFIFNSLNSINYFISNNDRLSANRYIADFARLIRSILGNMESDYVSFTGEMNSVRDYLGIEHLRFGDKFDYEIDFSSVKNPEDLEVFPGLIQPFAENAIWHGVRALEERKGKIMVRLVEDDAKKLICHIEDDGIGRKRAAEMHKGNGNHESRGMEIVRQRLEIISKLRESRYRLEISDLYPDRIESGTIVTVDIPIRYRH